jgi:hypothetical protein
MTDWPERGQKAPDFWDDDAKAYVDEHDAALETRIATLEAAGAGGDTKVVSTDGSYGLSAPTGVGFEWVITANELVGPFMNGVAL